jgi:hypothetical protein
MSGVLCGGTSIYRTGGSGRGLDLVSFVRVFFDLSLFEVHESLVYSPEMVRLLLLA